LADLAGCSERNLERNLRNVLSFSTPLDIFSQQMNAIDLKNEEILRELGRNARMTNLELAERVHLSPSACLRRVQEMERTGIIKGYRVVTDRVALGKRFVAYLAVGLSAHSRDAQKAFERAVAYAPEVRECHNVTGTIEFLMRIEVEDLEHYKRFHTDVLGTLPHVSSLTTYVVMDTSKDERA
jgi:Lrp/AsnC family leucine-responsive transcriptional regulator